MKLEDGIDWALFVGKVEDMFASGYKLPEPLHLQAIDKVECKLGAWKEKVSLVTSLPQASMLDDSEEEDNSAYDQINVSQLSPLLGKSDIPDEVDPPTGVDEAEGKTNTDLENYTVEDEQSPEIEKSKTANTRRKRKLTKDTPPSTPKRPRRSTPSTYRRDDDSETPKPKKSKTKLKASPRKKTRDASEKADVVVKTEPVEVVQPEEGIPETDDKAEESSKGKWKCELCFSTFRSEIRFKRHCERHEKTKLACERCPFIAITNSQLYNHVKSDHADDPSVLLPEKKKKKSELNKRGSFPCPKCDKVFTFRRNMIVHSEFHDLENGVRQCPHCSKEFRSNIGYQTHLRLHTGEAFPCELCQYVAGSKSTLSTHMKRTHQKLKKSLCDICGAGFITVYQMKRHKEVTHMRDHEKYKCPHCDHKTHCRSSYYLHIKNLHTETEGFTCRICGITLKYKNSLLDHEQRHSSKKTYPCNLCDFKGVCIKDVHNHMKRLHTEPKEKCDICGKCFKQRGHLVRHRVIHTGEKQFQCRLCSYCCNVKGNLRKHMLQVHKINERIRPAIDKIDADDDDDDGDKSASEVIMPQSQFNEITRAVQDVKKSSGKKVARFDVKPSGRFELTGITSSGNSSAIQAAVEAIQFAANGGEAAQQNLIETKMENSSDNKGSFTFVSHVPEDEAIVEHVIPAENPVQYMEVIHIDQHGNREVQYVLDSKPAEDVDEGDQLQIIESKVEVDDEILQQPGVFEEEIVPSVGAVEDVGMAAQNPVIQQMQYWSGS